MPGSVCPLPSLSHVFSVSSIEAVRDGANDYGDCGSFAARGLRHPGGAVDAAAPGAAADTFGDGIIGGGNLRGTLERAVRDAVVLATARQFGQVDQLGRLRLRAGPCSGAGTSPLRLMLECEGACCVQAVSNSSSSSGGGRRGSSGSSGGRSDSSKAGASGHLPASISPGPTATDAWMYDVRAGDAAVFEAVRRTAPPPPPPPPGGAVAFLTPPWETALSHTKTLEATRDHRGLRRAATGFFSPPAVRQTGANPGEI
jgi:hypothetical protein